MNRTDAARQSSTQWTLATIFIVAVGCNYVWELAQSSLYVGMDDFSRMNDVYKDYFPAMKPARSTVQVVKLPKDALIEIECIAATK